MLALPVFYLRLPRRARWTRQGHSQTQPHPEHWRSAWQPQSYSSRLPNLPILSMMVMMILHWKKTYIFINVFSNSTKSQTVSAAICLQYLTVSFVFMYSMKSTTIIMLLLLLLLKAMWIEGSFSKVQYAKIPIVVSIINMCHFTIDEHTSRLTAATKLKRHI